MKHLSDTYYKLLIPIVFFLLSNIMDAQNPLRIEASINPLWNKSTNDVVMSNLPAPEWFTITGYGGINYNVAVEKHLAKQFGIKCGIGNTLHVLSYQTLGANNFFKEGNFEIHNLEFPVLLTFRQQIVEHVTFLLNAGIYFDIYLNDKHRDIVDMPFTSSSIDYLSVIAFNNSRRICLGPGFSGNIESNLTPRLHIFSGLGFHKQQFRTFYYSYKIYNTRTNALAFNWDHNRTDLSYFMMNIGLSYSLRRL
jgi:hypothetical protein